MNFAACETLLYEFRRKYRVSSALRNKRANDILVIKRGYDNRSRFRAVSGIKKSKKIMKICSCAIERAANFPQFMIYNIQPGRAASSYQQRIYIYIYIFFFGGKARVRKRDKQYRRRVLKAEVTSDEARET